MLDQIHKTSRILGILRILRLPEQQNIATTSPERRATHRHDQKEKLSTLRLEILEQHLEYPEYLEYLEYLGRDEFDFKKKSSIYQNHDTHSDSFSQTPAKSSASALAGA